MKAAGGNLIALLATAKELVMWEVFTITLADGTVLTYTAGDLPGYQAQSKVGTENKATLT